MGSDGQSVTREVDARKLWAGGVATALVAALVALVAMLVATVAFDVSPVAPDWLVGESGDAALSSRFAATAAVAALLATGLLHLLLLSTPGPMAFFGWIIALLTLAAAVTPFAVGDDLDAQVATAVTAAAVGLVIGVLLSRVADSALILRQTGGLPDG